MGANATNAGPNVTNVEANVTNVEANGKRLRVYTLPFIVKVLNFAP